MAILIFIVVLIALVLVHEFGHFVSAKLFGMKVEEFGIGFPPKAASFKKGETTYSLNLLPLGGFVRIFGESGEGKENHRSYASRSAWQKSIVLVSGVFMNVLFTILIFWIAFTIGFPTAPGNDLEGTVSKRSVQIIDVANGSPAKEAGIERGDVIQKIQNPHLTFGEMAKLKSKIEKKIETVKELQDFTNENKGNLLILTIKRGGDILEKEVLARENPPQGEGSMGIVLADIGLISFPWYQALFKAITTTLKDFWLILKGIYLILSNLLFAGRVIGEIAGPVGIAAMVGDFYSLGIHYLLAFIGFISINLAVLNILPIPALDGGRLFFVGIEKLKGSPLKAETENKIHAVGFALLLTLVLLVTIRDILQL